MDRRLCLLHSISVVPLANEQPSVLCIEPQISLQEGTVKLQKKYEKNETEI